MHKKIFGISSSLAVARHGQVGKAFGEAVAQQSADRGLILPVLVLLECNAARFSVLNTLYFYPDAIIHPKVAGRVARGAGCCLEMRGGCSQPSCFLSQVCDFPQHHFAAVIHAPGLPPSPLPMFPISETQGFWGRKRG